jgi:branched-chain amino acid transport system ATP-binding protein
MTAARLSIKDISVRFGGLMALESVGLELGDNQLLGFIGPNGAGKTTLMRVITGIVRPVSGQVMLDGRNISTLSSVERIHAGVALGQQIVKPLREMSLLDNVALAFGREKLLSPLRALSVRSRDAEREAAKTILSDVGLGAAMHKLPNEVPLGYLKRLEVARALALRPRLLLLDEPLAGLSKPEAADMADLIAGLPRPGLSVILIEHNLPQVVRVCPTLYVQSNGRGLAFGPTDEVMAMPAVRKAYLGREG